MALGNLNNLQSLSRRSKGAKEVLLLNADEVIPKDGQVRQTFNGIEELAESIKVNGQEQPIIVYPKDADGKYRIQKGERRWRACKLAGLTIEAIVSKKELTDLDETAGELIENIQREDLTPMEIALALQKFIDADWKAIDVAKRLGKSRSYVSQHLALLKLPECVKRLYDEGITTDAESLNSLRQLYELEPEKATTVCEKAMEEGITRKACRSLLKLAKSGQLPASPDVSGEVAPPPSATGVGTHDDQPALKGLSGTQAGENGDIDTSWLFEGGESPGGDASPTSAPAGAAGTGGAAAGEPIPGQGKGQAPTPEKPAQQPVAKAPKPQEPEASQQPAGNWTPAVPVRARIVVSIKIQGQLRSGTLLLDRVDAEPGYCWVQLDGKESEPVRVTVSEVKLLGVEGEE